MRGRHFPWVAGFALVALACVAGCGQARTTVPAPTATATPAPMPTPTPSAVSATAAVVPQFTSLYVLRIGTPFDKTVTDAATIQHLYQAIQALPAFPASPFSCPPDTTGNEAYALTFSGTSVETVSVNIQIGGCQGVLFNGAHGWTQWVAQTPGFWQQFAETLGVPVSTILPPYR